MSPTSLFSQVLMIIVAVVVGVMYIYPTIGSIKATQDSTELYQQELVKISNVNSQLAAQVAKVDSVPLEAKQALIKFVPDSIDEISVMKDIRLILAQAGLEPTSLAYGAGSSGDERESGQSSAEVVEVDTTLPYITHDFSVSFESTYDQVKALFSILETNDYLLQISSLGMIPAESGLVTVDMNLQAFSRVVVDQTAQESEVDIISDETAI